MNLRWVAMLFLALVLVPMGAPWTRVPVGRTARAVPTDWTDPGPPGHSVNPPAVPIG